VPKRISAVAFMGGIELDLREATLGPGVTEIEVLAVMGGVVVTVPPNVRLECDGFAFMGGFEDQLKQPASGDPNAPAVRLTGFAFMGGVEARVLEPGAPAD
jgi:predicted membrane protein